MDPKDNSSNINTENHTDKQVQQVDHQKVQNPHKGKLAKRIVIISVSIIVVLFATILLYFHFHYAQLNQAIAYGSALPTDDMELDTEEPAATNLPEVNPSDIQSIINVTAAPIAPTGASKDDKKALNVLLLGVDTRNPNSFNGRTDTIIIAHIDPNRKTIKLISIMRDTLLQVPNHKDLNRINTVLEFGGPDAVMSTIQRYFGIPIDYYAIVNFWAIADIIDALGGVDINVQQDEIGYINSYLDEINMYKKDDTNSPHISKSGSQMLDGKQAVAYMRIRYVGGADYQRTERQRTVLINLAKKDRSALEILDIVNRLPNNVRTNANELQLASLAEMMYDLRNSPIKELRIPVPGTFRGGRYNGMSILILDFPQNAKALQDFLNN